MASKLGPVGGSIGSKGSFARAHQFTSDQH